MFSVPNCEESSRVEDVNSVLTPVIERSGVVAGIDAELHVVTAYKAMRGAKIKGAPDGAAKVWAPLPDDAARPIVEEAGAMAGL